jgi:uncharacterized LabA/DUF88 family protein
MTYASHLHRFGKKMLKPQRVMVFIDGSNMFYCSRKLGFRLDYRKMADALTRDRDLVRAYFFGSEDIDSPNPNQRAFLIALRMAGLEVVARPLRSRRLQTGETTKVEKGVDIAMVSFMLRFAFIDAYDVAIIATGDEDFVVAAQTIKDLGKRVEVAGFEGATAAGLRQVADTFVSLNKIAGEIEWKHETTDGRQEAHRTPSS